MTIVRLTFITLMAMLLCWGCASGNGQKVISRESEYQKMLELQKGKEALTVEKESAGNLPKSTAESYERLGDMYVRQGNTAMAAVQYGNSLQLEPGRTGVRYKFGSLYLAKGMTEQALLEFEEIVKKEPENGLGYQGKGLALLRKGQAADAEENLTKAVTLKPDLWQAHLALGTIYDRQKKFSAAIDEYYKAIAINPHAAPAFNNLGMSYFLSGDYERSLEALAQALKLDPSNRKISNNLGVVLFKMGRREEALRYLEDAKDQATAYNNAGYLYMSEGKYREAADAFDKAVQAKPQFYEKAQDNLQRARALADQQPAP